MSHNNRLSPRAEQDWRESLADVEHEHADDPGEPVTLPAPPWDDALDVRERLDALEDQGRP